MRTSTSIWIQNYRLSKPLFLSYHISIPECLQTSPFPIFLPLSLAQASLPYPTLLLNIVAVNQYAKSAHAAYGLVYEYNSVLHFRFTATQTCRKRRSKVTTKLSETHMKSKLKS